MSGSHVKKKQKYDEMLKCGVSKDATEAFKRKPYEAIDVATYLEGKVGTIGQRQAKAVQGTVKGDGVE